jgi:hypothetical protein
VAKWVAAEEKRAIGGCRRQFRGEAQVRDDKDMAAAVIASINLVLWGDPGSNRVLAPSAGRLPVKSAAQAVAMGKDRYSADKPVLPDYAALDAAGANIVLAGFRNEDWRM